MGRGRIIDPKHRRLISEAFEMLKSIANPSCMRIIRIIEDHGEITVSQIQKATQGKYPIAQPVISSKLSILRKYGMVKSEAIGKYRVYSMNTNQMRKLNHITRKLAEVPKKQYA